MPSSFYIALLVFRLNLPSQIFEKTLSTRQEILLRFSSAFPCGLLLYLGDYWKEAIEDILIAISNHDTSLGPEIILYFIISAFIFIIIILLNTYIFRGMIVPTRFYGEEKIESYDELAGSAVIITFFLAAGGMMIVDAIIIIATTTSLLKIIKVRKIDAKQNQLFQTIMTGEKLFWSIFKKKRKNTRNFFFYVILSTSGLVLMINIAFIDYSLPTQILFLFVVGVVAYLGYYGIKKDWSKTHQMFLPILPYVTAFLLVMYNPIAMPFNSFLSNSLNQLGISFSDSLLYAVPLFTFIIIFGFITSTVPSIAAAENKTKKTKYFVYHYIGDIVGYFTYALIFELFFLPSISTGWTYTIVGNITVESPLPTEGKTLLLIIGGGVLILGSIFSAIATSAEMKSLVSRQLFKKQEKIRTGIILFLVFLVASIGASLVDGFLVFSTQIHDDKIEKFPGVLAIAWTWNLFLLIPHVWYSIKNK